MTKRKTTPPGQTATMPLYFCADECLRCGTPLTNSTRYPIVTGGPQVKYHGIGLLIDESCQQGPDFDVLVCWLRYRNRSGKRLTLGRWPRYVGPPTALTGYAKVSMLDNGLARVGLHRGHVEHWSATDVQTIGGFHGSYAPDYMLYGPAGMFPHQVIAVRFYDLAQPITIHTELRDSENVFIHGPRHGER